MASHVPACLHALPDELLLLVLSHLSVLDLLQMTRTSHRLRKVALDPQLHQQRRQLAVKCLESSLLHRPARAALAPPHAQIWLNKTHVLSRSISRSLVKIRLGHSLEIRPTIQALKDKAILPAYITVLSPVLAQCQRSVYHNRLKDGLCRKLTRRPSINSLVSLNILPEECARQMVSPALVERRRRVMKEALKDHLKAWIENRGLRAQRQKAIELDAEEKKTVKALARKLTARCAIKDAQHSSSPMTKERKRAQAPWGRSLTNHVKKERTTWDGADCPHPTRAHVRGMRLFWEGVMRAATS